MYILASASPRRAQLLTQMGLTFTVDPSDCDESFATGLPPEEMVPSLSRRKAESVTARHPGETVIAADTVVAFREQVLGKPRDREDAVEMLMSLSGKTHHVYTGVTVARDRRVKTFVSMTAVTFAPFTREEAEAYAATGEPDDKAGAYGIQGKGALLVERINGDYFTVVGLPICRLANVLREFESNGTINKYC